MTETFYRKASRILQESGTQIASVTDKLATADSAGNMIRILDALDEDIERLRVASLLFRHSVTSAKEASRG